VCPRRAQQRRVRDVITRRYHYLGPIRSTSAQGATRDARDADVASTASAIGRFSRKRERESERAFLESGDFRLDEAIVQRLSPESRSSFEYFQHALAQRQQ